MLLALASLTTPAAAAVTASYSPWAALSAFASVGSSRALCAAAAQDQAPVASAADLAGQGTRGCVLPLTDPAPLAELPGAVAGVGPVSPAVTGVTSGLSIAPLLAGLAAIAAFSAYVFSSDNQNAGNVGPRPISP